MRTSIWDVLALMGMLATMSVASIFLLIFSDPYTALNPFPPPTLPPTVVIPTSTATLRSLPATWTPTPGIEGGPQWRPSSTPVPTLTGFRLSTWTFTPTRTRTPTQTSPPTSTPARTQTPLPTYTSAPSPTLNQTAMQQTVDAAVKASQTASVEAATLTAQVATNVAISQTAEAAATQTAAQQTADAATTQTAAQQTADAQATLDYCATQAAPGTPCP